MSQLKMEPVRSRLGNCKGLLLLNGALLAVLAAITFSPGADAQIRPRGEYLMTTGNVPSSDAGVVFILDTVNEEMVAVTYDHNVRDLSGVGYRSLVADAGARRRN